MTLLQSKINEALLSFCGPDRGRSVSFHSQSLGLLEIRGQTPRPVASILKVPMVMALYDMAQDGQIDLATPVARGTLAPTRYNSILSAIEPATTFSLREIAGLALITSDNPLAVHLTDIVGYPRVTAVMQRLGCRPDSKMAAGFTDPELGAANRVNLMTTNDAVKIFGEVQAQQRYADIFRALANNLRNSRLPAFLPESAIVAHKTGSLAGVVNDAGIIQDTGVDFILAAMSDGQADPVETGNDIGRCALSIYETLLAAA